jgi:uncharacterized DUF497 family protein
LTRKTIVYTPLSCGSSGIRKKAEANLGAHGVCFAEAVTVLEDDFALTREDPDADDEVRFVTLDLSSLASLLVVVYVYRRPGIIRMISA